MTHSISIILLQSLFPTYRNLTYDNGGLYNSNNDLGR